ncbi:MAG: HAMP domain-containing sensor histidine kinase [Terricaulis sp.]
MIQFETASMRAAARAHVESLHWRLAVWGVFALGAALALDSFAAGAAWLLAVALSMGFDAMLGGSYLNARRPKEQRTSGALFVWGCAFSALVFSAMPLYLVAQGGGAGRVLGVLMAASAFVRVLLFLSRARGFMVIVGAPSALCLLAMPFLPIEAAHSNPMQSALAAGCGVVAFLAYVARASLYQNAMLERVRAAHAQAKQEQQLAQAKRAEAEEANRAKSEFLTVMTHELRTPLNAVIGYAEILREDLSTEQSTSRADAERIERSARHLLGLIDRILNYAGADAATPAALRVVDVRALLEAQIQSSLDEMKAAGNRVSLLVTPEAEQSLSDPSRMGACVAVLLSNAAKFTKQGLIAVTAERRGDDLAISVSDTGPGIAEEELPRLFTPFSQTGDVRTRAEGGVGLGLAMAQRSASLLGGEISVRSELGRGSTFLIRLPITPPPGATALAA